MTYPLARRARAPLLDLDTFATRARLHPELVRRLVALGLLEAQRGSGRPGWVGAGRTGDGRADSAAAGRLLAELRRPRAGAGPARPHRGSGGCAAAPAGPDDDAPNHHHTDVHRRLTWTSTD